MILHTSKPDEFRQYIDKLILPNDESHKGQNGKALIIGGSTLFHSASLWSAEIASHFLDMVHYSSTEENEAIFLKLKTIFRNGIIVHKNDLPEYVKEDDAILIGPGMVRGEITNPESRITNFEEIISLNDESTYTRELTRYLLSNYPEKRFVIDAGALQMMDKEWLHLMKTKPILTPHQGEFNRLFNIDVIELSIEEKAKVVEKYAKEYNSIIILKAITDIVSDGEQTICIEGGNQGLTKGGSGDILAGLITSLYTKNDPVICAVVASFLLKYASDQLKEEKGYWYNMNNLIQKIPEMLTQTLSGRI